MGAGSHVTRVFGIWIGTLKVTGDVRHGSETGTEMLPGLTEQ